MLVNHAQTGVNGIARRVEMDPLPIDGDRAFFRLVHAGQHVHQGAFARAVFAEQSMHLALAQIEIHVVIGEDAGEPFDNAPHLDGVDSLGHGDLRGRVDWEMVGW